MNVIQALPSPMTTLTQLDEWIKHADTHRLPDERIPSALTSGQTGMDFNWPRAMVGDTTVQMLNEKKLRLTSQCIQLAGCMTKDQFQAFMQGGRPSFAYLYRTVFDVASQYSSVSEYENRKSRWDKDALVANISILENWLLPRVLPEQELTICGRQENQLQRVANTIAENKARLSALQPWNWLKWAAVLVILVVLYQFV